VRRRKDPTMQPNGPLCQSCAMPLDSPESMGTKADGSRSPDYCRHCFQKGTFTDPDISMNAMIDKCVAILARMKIMPEPQARESMARTIPTLERWKR
jgi:hypothetical protein